MAIEHAEDDVRMEEVSTEESEQYLYNAWLPVAQESRTEKHRFHEVVSLLQLTWKPHDLDTRFATLKWIPVISMFLKVKSQLDLQDLEAVVKIGLDVILRSSDNFFVQVRWGQLLVSKILKKFGKKLELAIEWQPLYKLVHDAHFKRRKSYEGLALNQIHLENMTSLVRLCRRFFPPTAAIEIWREFRPAFDDLSHNSSLEAVGFVSLFLPSTLHIDGDVDTPLLTRDWLIEVLHLWAAVPNCNFWNLQWASLLSRVIKHSSSWEVWEPLLPTLFTFYLRSFEVPVGGASASSPIQWEVPRDFIIAFNSGWSLSASKVNAKSIVYLLKEGGSAQHELEVLVDLLEQYFHPSNGGPWTSGLEHFLRNLVHYFLKRLAGLHKHKGRAPQISKMQRAAFVKAVLRLSERGKYSKNPSLASTAASCASTLAFVEPDLVLPLVVSQFHTAMDTITATHQLQTAVTSLALVARAIILASSTQGSTQQDGILESDAVPSPKETLVVAMFDTLLGMDANDPPKTLATLQLYCSVFSSVGVLGDQSDGGSDVLPIDWSDWLNEFLSRLFTLLVHLEPSSQSGDAGSDSGSHLVAKTFLMHAGSFYHHVIEILFGRLTRPLYLQALRKVARFVHGQVLPGAVAEVGFLCTAAVYASPADAVPQLLGPLMDSILSALADAPVTGLSGDGPWAEFKVGLSPGLELSVTYQLNVLAIAVMYGGPALLQYEKLLIQIIGAAFDAPSSKVNEAGSRVLSGLLGSLVLYYPTDQHRVHTDMDGAEAWITMKGPVDDGPKWHYPNNDEIAFANHLLSLHLQSPLACLRSICNENRQANSSGQLKEWLRVLLLRVDASLRGVRSCLPDFQTGFKDHSGQPLVVAGAAGATVGSVVLREETATTLHTTFEFLVKERADDSVLLVLLIQVLDLAANYGGIEYGHWVQERTLWQYESKCFTEPKVNFITNPQRRGKRWPRWLVVEMVHARNALRASQNGYRHYQRGVDNFVAPSHVALLSKDLLTLSLHHYDAVRSLAAGTLGKLLKRFQMLVKDCMPILTGRLQDTGDTEDSALGACRVLMSRPILRHLMQDWSDLVRFLLALLNSSHHDSVKAQTAINELFIVFNVRSGGLRVSSLSHTEEQPETMTYTGLINHIKNRLADGALNIHWRYNLMAQGMLLLLVVPPVADKDLATSSAILGARQLICDQFLSNLTSELPPLRPLSVAALLLLLQPGPHKMSSKVSTHGSAQNNLSAALCVQQSVVSMFQGENFGEKVVGNLAVDHVYTEGQGRGVGGLRSMQELGLTALLPSFLRDWPRTQTWDATMSGEAFSPNHAKLFKRLVQEGGVTVLDALRAPVEKAISAVEERGNQSVSAEVLAGLLHSDVTCVVDAWGIWIRPLLRKALLQSTVESAPEWAACVRFAVTGKGPGGCSAPLLRYQILESLSEPLAPASASTSLVTKRLMFLQAALVEVLPASRLKSENLYQASLLSELLTCMNHPASQGCVPVFNAHPTLVNTALYRAGMRFCCGEQVREGVGNLMCVVAGNLSIALRLAATSHGTDAAVAENMVSVDESIKRWSMEMVEGAAAAASKIQIRNGQTLGGTALAVSSSIGPLNSSGVEAEVTEGDAAAKWMETALFFVSASIKSGRAVPLNSVIVGLLHPIFSLQETADKELSALAKGVLRLLNSAAPFDSEQVGGAVTAVLAATSDLNWHTRFAALTFLQSLVYRHTFILAGTAMAALWRRVQELLSDPQLEVRDFAATTLSGMLKGTDGELAKVFREQSLAASLSFQGSTIGKNRKKGAVGNGLSTASVHGIVLGLAACVLSMPYDMPSWLPEMVTQLAKFSKEPAPLRTTVTKTIAEFRRTHFDTWSFQKAAFTEEQLEVLTDLTNSASYFV